MDLHRFKVAERKRKSSARTVSPLVNQRVAACAGTRFPPILESNNPEIFVATRESFGIFRAPFARKGFGQNSTLTNADN
jgi:hypothetical protein